MTRYYFIDWFILRLVLILKENISVAEDFHLAHETLATTVNLDTDIDLWSNDMSNTKHANIGTRLNSDTHIAIDVMVVIVD